MRVLRLVLGLLLIGCGSGLEPSAEDGTTPEGPVPPAIVGRVEPAQAGIGVLAFRNGVQTRSTLTNSQGNYALEELLPGEYNLVASGAGFFTDTSVQGLRVGWGEVVQAPLIRLRPLDAAATLQGVVLDAVTGAPLADVTVVVRCRTGICANLEARTDAQGRFETKIWPDLPGELLVQKDGYVPLSVPFDPLAPNAQLELPPLRLPPE